MIYGTIQKVDILAIGVHPDDIELGCSGTLLSHIAKGYTVGILDLTRGELGTRGNPELRAQEASNAARMMGASFRVILDCRDGFITFNERTCLSIIEIIRASQPTIILANAKQDRHPDHGRAAKITADAAYLSGLSQIESFHQGAQQDKWRPNAVYHYLQDETENPDFVVNVSQFIDQKFDLILCFSSQFYTAGSTEPMTPISGRAFLDFVKAKGAVVGRPAGYDYGEGFQVNRYIGVENLFHID